VGRRTLASVFESTSRSPAKSNGQWSQSSSPPFWTLDSRRRRPDSVVSCRGPRAGGTGQHGVTNHEPSFPSRLRSDRGQFIPEREASSHLCDQAETERRETWAASFAVWEGRGRTPEEESVTRAIVWFGWLGGPALLY
jgi:hypothetical protein